MPARNKNPFKLKDFRGVNLEHITRLEKLGIKNTGQLISAGQTAEKRERLATQAGIPVEVVLELVKLSDLARLPGVKGIRAQLYYDAGVDTVENLASFEPPALLRLTDEFVQQPGSKEARPSLRK